MDIEHFEKWRRRGPDNPEDPSNVFWETLNVGSISSRKHEMGILGNLEYGIKISEKHVVTFCIEYGISVFKNTLIENVVLGNLRNLNK